MAPAEAQRLAAAMDAVAQQFPFTADPRTRSIVQLGVVAGQIYAPRVVAIRHRRREQAQGTPSATAGMVVQGQNVSMPAGPASVPQTPSPQTPSQLDPDASLMSALGNA